MNTQLATKKAEAANIAEVSQQTAAVVFETNKGYIATTLRDAQNRGFMSEDIVHTVEPLNDDELASLAYHEAMMQMDVEEDFHGR